MSVSLIFIYLSRFCLQQMVIVSFFKIIFWFTCPSLFSFIRSWSVLTGKNSLILKKQGHLTVSVQDPVSGAFLTPGSEIGFSGSRISDLENLMTIFGTKSYRTLCKLAQIFFLHASSKIK
jgi:hypothetical protein